jgi:hypothetical protein
MVALALLAPLVAGAVVPSRKHALDPKSTGLLVHDVSFRSTRDSVGLHGWWFEGPPASPVLVMCPRGRGTMADLIPSVVEFARRGFTVMTFDLRDFGPDGPGPADSLRDLVYASRWVSDAEGALRFARTNAPGRRVFAWGQDLGSPVAAAACSRQLGNADGVAIEGTFQTSQEQIYWNGTSQNPGVAKHHRLLVEGADEPRTAIGNLKIPLFVVLALRDSITPADKTSDAVSMSLGRVERWRIPDAGHEGVEKTPGYYDRLAAWYKRVAFDLNNRPAGY